MEMNWILRCLWVALTVIAAIFPAYPADDDVENFVVQSGVPSESLSMMILDLREDTVVAQYNIDAPLIPASILKTVTIASLLKKTGPDWRYVTDVYTTGPCRKGVLEGDILAVGSGDPTLDAPCGPKSGNFVDTIVEVLQDLRVSDVEGRIVVDGSIFSGPATPPSWAAADLHQSYGTGSHGFNFRSNASGKSSVANPASVFESALNNAMAINGICLRGSSLPQGEPELLLSHESAPVDEIMRSCMMRSDNLFAESLLRTYSVLCGGDGSTADGARREMKLWERQHLPMEGVEIVDGSGLSRSNRVTALFIAELLRKMSSDVIYASFFPLAGQEGTLKHFLAGTPLDSYIAMKTGSMSGIQCYAGYKLDDDYAPTHVVVVIANRMADRARLRSALQTLLLKTFCD